MFYTILATLIFYLGMKLCHLMVGPTAGYRRFEATLRDRIRAGEPMLLIGTIGVSALLVTFGTWWHHRFLHAHYVYATNCYPKMAAAHLLPAMPDKFGSFDAAEAAAGYVRSAEIHGTQLGMQKADIDRKLIEASTAYSEYYARLAKQNARQKIAASFADLDRCLTGQGRPRGELLRT